MLHVPYSLITCGNYDLQELFNKLYYLLVIYVTCNILVTYVTYDFCNNLVTYGKYELQKLFNEIHYSCVICNLWLVTIL